MNRAEYLSTAVASGGNGLYPLSTQGLSFIQDQITFLQAFARIGGKRYILLAPTATADGVVVIDGEVLRFKAAAKPGNGIQIRETTENIVADGTTYREARIYRYAEYVPTYTKNVAGLYRLGFSMIETNDQLAKKLLDYTAVNSELAKKLTVLSTDSLTRYSVGRAKGQCAA